AQSVSWAPVAPTAVPATYTLGASASSMNLNHMACGAAHAVIPIASSEDPGEFTIAPVNDLGATWGWTFALSIAGAPGLATGDHLHVHDALTGREDIVVNHGSGAS